MSTVQEFVIVFWFKGEHKSAFLALIDNVITDLEHNPETWKQFESTEYRSTKEQIGCQIDYFTPFKAYCNQMDNEDYSRTLQAFPYATNSGGFFEWKTVHIVVELFRKACLQQLFFGQLAILQRNDRGDVDDPFQQVMYHFQRIDSTYVQISRDKKYPQDLNP